RLHLRRFNGAAFFRTRSPEIPMHLLRTGLVASTEPRSFERGVSERNGRGRVTPFCFNGAAFFRTRSPPRHQHRCAHPAQLQRSRVLSNAESMSPTRISLLVLS